MSSGGRKKAAYDLVDDLAPLLPPLVPRLALALALHHFCLSIVD